MLILFIIDLAAGRIFTIALQHIKTGQQAATTYAVSKVDQQLIILGSSRATQQYIPDIFQDTLKLTSYNAGNPGMTFLYYYSIFRSVLTRNTPVVVIVDLLPFEFEKSDDHYTELASLLPYYKSQPVVRPIVNLRSPYEKYKAISNLYCYNSLLGPLFRDVLRNSKSNKGYYATFDKLRSTKLGSVNMVEKEIDTVIVNRFVEMIKRSKAVGSNLFVLISPTYQDYPHKPETIKIAEKICAEQNIYFKDYSQDSFFLKHPEYFKNTFHLNNDGATIYSRILAHEIRKYLVDDQARGSSLGVSAPGVSSVLQKGGL